MSTSLESVFLQYGSLGAITVILLLCIRVMFQRLQDAMDRERTRADRLEEELRKLNETVRSEYLTTISQASRAVADAMSAVQRRGRDDKYERN